MRRDDEPGLISAHYKACKLAPTSTGIRSARDSGNLARLGMRNISVGNLLFLVRATRDSALVARYRRSSLVAPTIIIMMIISSISTIMPTPIFITDTSIEPIDIWRAARLMVKRHGEVAPIECALKADEFLDRGDVDGQALWLAIRRAAKALLENGVPPDIPAGPTH